MMKERTAYSIILPFTIIGLTILSIDMYVQKLHEISTIGYVGAFLAITGTIIFFYHFYTILDNKQSKPEVSQE